MDDYIIPLLAIYVIMSIPLAGFALWLHFDNKDEIEELKKEIKRLDDDIDEIWPHDDDPNDDGEQIIEYQNTNVVAFHKKV